MEVEEKFRQARAMYNQSHFVLGSRYTVVSEQGYSEDQRSWMLNKEGMTMPERSLGLVWGYLPEIDDQSDTAKGLGLTQRFSIVFNRYPDSAPCVYVIEFPGEFILGVCGAVLSLFPHDAIRAVDDAGTPHSDLESACLVDPKDGEQSSFVSVTITQSGVATCHIEFEPYCNCGGPHPYHDAFVYAFYCSQIERQAVQDNLFSFCLKNQIILTDIVSGCQQPVHVPWHRRLWRYFW